MWGGCEASVEWRLARQMSPVKTITDRSSLGMEGEEEEGEAKARFDRPKDLDL